MKICVNKKIATAFMTIAVSVLFIIGCLTVSSRYSKNSCAINIASGLLITCKPILTPTPISPTITYLKAPKSSNEIRWKTYNFTNEDKKVAFAFQYPEVGDLCNGCFDGAGMATNYFGTWITGGYYKESSAGTWSLMVNVYLPNAAKMKDRYFDEEIGGRVAKFKSIRIGEHFQETDGGGLVSTTTRMNDMVTMKGTYARHFRTIGQGTRIGEMAIIELPDYTVVLSYSHVSPIYDVFEKIILSFSPDLYATPNKGETLEHYNKRLDGTPSWK